MHTTYSFIAAGTPVRVVTVGNECWFPVSDLNALLKLEDTEQTIADFCAYKERSNILIPDADNSATPITMRLTRCISLGGVGNLPIRSNWERAVRDWIKDVVLPTIHKEPKIFDGEAEFHLDEMSETEFLHHALSIADEARAECDPVLEDRAALLLSCVDRDAVIEVEEKRP